MEMGKKFSLTKLKKIKRDRRITQKVYTKNQQKHLFAGLMQELAVGG